MTKNINSSMQFKDFRITEFLYVCPSEYEPARDDHNAVNITFRFEKTTVQASDTQFTVELRCFAWIDGSSYDEASYKIKVSLCGLFEAVPQFDIRWERNAVAILFPYIRAIISSVTGQSGRDPIILPTVNISAMFDENSEPKA